MTCNGSRLGEREGLVFNLVISKESCALELRCYCLKNRSFPPNTHTLETPDVNITGLTEHDFTSYQ